jgi:hypothetical protein
MSDHATKHGINTHQHPNVRMMLCIHDVCLLCGYTFEA